MSFTGAGPLGTSYWGTTTERALQAQATTVVSKYEVVAEAIKNKGNTKDFPAQPFPEIHSVLKPNSKELNLVADKSPEVWPAAVFTSNELENWPADKRATIAQRKKEFSDQPQDIVDATREFRDANLKSLQRRHAAIEGVSAAQRDILNKVASWFSALVVNIRVREILVYPLIRDQIEGGDKFYDGSLNANDNLKTLLRGIRKSIYDDANTTQWYSQLAEIHTQYTKSWEEEKAKWVPKLSEYLLKAHSQALRDICAAHDKPGIEEPNPPTNHDLNYGQQISQMNEIMYLHIVRTGNMQGIPRPRHEVDWACTDGYEPAYRPTYDEVDGLQGKPPKSDIHGVGKFKEREEPTLATSLPPATNSTLPYIGTGIPRLVEHPDASNKDVRKKFEEDNEKSRVETLQAIKKARLAKYGSEEAEKAADDAHLIAVAAERAQSLQEFLLRKPHSTDLEGSYYFNEVQLAFRNHGTHWETLNEDITPLGHHYLLIHYDVQFFKSTEDNYRLKVFGCVTNPVVLTLQQIKDLAGKERTFSMPMMMECSGNGRAMMKPRYNQHVPWGLQAFGCYCWTGTPLRVLIDRVGVTSDCIDVVFTGYDAGLEHEKELRYFQHSLNIHDPVIDHSWLIWMNNGVDLLPEHGYPLRLMVPAWYGNANIKWLRSIEFIPRKFKGVYQRTYSYTKTTSDNDIAVPSQELRPKAMVAPIGYPDFTTRKRTAIAGQQTFRGKCWVGGGHYRAVIHVELSLDGGKTWLPCKLEPRIGIFAWANYSLTIDIPVGMYIVAVRATDNLGQRQTISLDWNYASMQDDAIQFYTLTVVETLSVME